MRAANRAAGAHLLFLPKHSPDPNPIKQVSAKLKTLIRKNGAGPYDALGEAAAETLAKFTTRERAAYLKSQGARNINGGTLQDDKRSIASRPGKTQAFLRARDDGRPGLTKT